MIKIIKTNKDYDEALKNVESLMDRDSKPGSSDANKLELLLLLIKDYEDKYFPVEAPDPIEAILFRMEQEDLQPRNLIPYIGSRSKVSEVLSRKRPLTLTMIRALHEGLGIPIKSLIKEDKPKSVESDEIDWSFFPVREIIKRGWVKTHFSDIKAHAKDIILEFLQPLDSENLVPTLYRMTENVRTARKIDRYSLMMWNARIIILSNKYRNSRKYKKGRVSKEFIKEIIQLSNFNDGPKRAREFLMENGIPLVVEPHLPRTHLDGAAILTENGPTIGLTIRYDRLDNFWFSLAHELSHIHLHLEKYNMSFFDYELEADTDDPKEKEADEFASECLVPSSEWKISPASTLQTTGAANRLAKKLNIHPAIVAGKMRHYFKNYRILNQLIGHNEVKKYFEDVEWR
ncbi:MAG: ImmA/IrrE family metallo-endopeptidase [Thermodesulfobacteriota bacterium]